MKYLKASESTLVGATSLMPSIYSALLINWLSVAGPEVAISSAIRAFRRRLFLLDSGFFSLPKCFAAHLSSGFEDFRSWLRFLDFLSNSQVHPGRKRGGFGGNIASHGSMGALVGRLELSSRASVVLFCERASILVR